ncbi:MAG: hypothetical protein K8S54_12545 [Spirochaetia bacterium]|nr:hypothetical protein [Spirochaetia bacterium]
MRRFSTGEYLGAALRAAFVAPAYLLRPYRSRAHIERFQFNRIRKLLFHAYTHSEFYRTKYRAAGIHPRDFQSLGDLIHFPTVSKDEMIQAISANALHSNSKFGQGSIESVSSGSSGKVIRVSHNVNETHAYAVGRYRILNMRRNLSPFDKTLYVYTSEFPARSFFGFYRSYFISTLNDITDTIQKIMHIRPAVLCIYPSHLFEIARHIPLTQARGLKLKLISLNSEMSSAAQRAALAEFFGCPVLDEYSTEELGWVAAECSHGTYHVWEDMAYLEILDDSDERRITGEIVGTNLHNFATPFIRYRQGDLGTLGTGSCACGRSTIQLTGLLGRRNDSFVLNGQTLTPAYLLDTVYNLLLVDRFPIADFCLIQDAQDSVRMQLVLQVARADDIASEVKRSLQNLLPSGTRVQVEITNTLLKTLTGKRNPIISLLSQ